MFAIRHEVVATTTAGSSTVTAYTPMVNGRLISIRLKGGHTFGSTGTVTVTNEGTGESLTVSALGSTAGFTKYPRATVVTSTGGAIKPSTGSAMPDYMVLANERIKAVVAKAGASHTGTFVFTIG